MADISEKVVPNQEQQNNLNTCGIGTRSSSYDSFENNVTSESLNFHPPSSENNISPQNEYSDVTEGSDDCETFSTVQNASVNVFVKEEMDVEKSNFDEKRLQMLVAGNPYCTNIPERSPDPRIPPKVGCLEKIVFCIDMSADMNEPPFKLGTGTLFSPLCMVKRVIDMYVQNKLKINPAHQFAIMGFHETAVWVRDFTNDIKEVNSALDQIKQLRVCKDSGLSPVFTLLSYVASDLPAPLVNPDIAPPPFVFRVILIYGRSNCIPENVEKINMLQMLKSSPYFYLDILYIHETPSPQNKCQEVFEHLCDLDDKDTSYIFEVARNTTKLHNCMAKLLAHPLQRPLQKRTHYKFTNEDSAIK